MNLLTRKKRLIFDTIFETVASYYSIRIIDFRKVPKTKTSIRYAPIGEIAKQMIIYLSIRFALMDIEEITEKLNIELNEVKRHYINSIQRFKVDVRFRREYLFLTDKLSGRIENTSFSHDELNLLFTITCDRYMVKPEQVRSASRMKEVLTARHLFHFLARSIIVPKPKETVVGMFTNRDHTSVIHSIKNVEQWICHDKTLNADIAYIREDFSNQSNRLNN